MTYCLLNSKQLTQLILANKLYRQAFLYIMTLCNRLCASWWLGVVIFQNIYSDHCRVPHIWDRNSETIFQISFYLPFDQPYLELGLSHKTAPHEARSDFHYGTIWWKTHGSASQHAWHKLPSMLSYGSIAGLNCRTPILWPSLRWRKWLSFYRRHFQIDSLNWIFCLVSNVTEVSIGCAC